MYEDLDLMMKKFSMYEDLDLLKEMFDMRKEAVLKEYRYNFVEESNRIEAIHREPTQEELEEFDRFLDLKEVSVTELQRFVKVYEPTAKLRLNSGDNVYIGDHIPPKGGQDILYQLDSIINSINRNNKNAYHNHIDYETLHPFTDGNGRSGRALWAWEMLKNNQSFSLGFLHTFYYQTLSNTNRP